MILSYLYNKSGSVSCFRVGSVLNALDVSVKKEKSYLHRVENKTVDFNLVTIDYFLLAMRAQLGIIRCNRRFNDTELQDFAL